MLILAAFFCITPPARAGTVPGAVVQISIGGETTGSQVVTDPGSPPDPASDCPAGYAQTGYHSTAAVRWSATYRGVLVSLARATGTLMSRKPPTSSGGVTGGEFTLSGNANNASDCSTGRPFSFSATLSQHSGRSALPKLERSVGSDIFFLGQIAANPTSFSLAGSDGPPDRVGDMLPFFTLPDAYFLPTQSSKSVQAGYVDVGVDWNKLLNRLGALRHKRSFTVQAHGSFQRTYGGFSASVLDSNGIMSDDCDSAKSDYGSGNAICSESTTSDYTITVRRTKLVTIVRG